jgi:hypothetical protein
MRIQRQNEMFSWRFAADFNSEDEWLAHKNFVDSTLTDLYHRKIDSRKAYGDVYGKEFEPTDADRTMMYNRVLDIMRRTGGPGNYQETGGRGLAAIPRQHRALLMAGVGGSGKGSILENPHMRGPLGYGQSFVINPDDTKLVMARLGMVPTEKDLQERYDISMPGWDRMSAMERSPFIHEEASWLTNRLADQLHQDGYNVIHDGTLGKMSKIDKLTRKLRDAGYKPENGGFVNAAGVDIPVEEALGRAGGRHKSKQSSYLQKFADVPDFDHRIPLLGQKYNLNPNDDSRFGIPDEGDSGGRALPAAIHAENNDPSGRASSLPILNFPYTQSATDSSILFNGMYPKGGMPEVLGGHGPHFQGLIPPGRLQRMGRRVMGSDEAEEYTVRHIIEDFEQQRIDLRMMVRAIVERLKTIEREEDYSYYGTSHLADDDLTSFWMYRALDKGAMSKEDYDAAMSVLRPIIFHLNS